MSYEIVVDVEGSEGVVERRVFARRSITVGRHPDNDIAVTLQRVPGRHHIAYSNCSRRHGMIEIAGGRLVLHDLGTSNGWHVLNEEGVQPGYRGAGHPIEIGDRYFVGDTVITIVSFRAG